MKRKKLRFSDWSQLLQLALLSDIYVVCLIPAEYRSPNSGESYTNLPQEVFSNIKGGTVKPSTGEKYAVIKKYQLLFSRK